MSAVIRLVSLLFFVVTLSACADPTTYPISREECSPNDPVHDLDAALGSCPAAI
ncbi:hypothetical protein [Roseovarius sp. CAU 1744]|uniref:hypothetical protein n=1 Tax=Roseovarius sp. CAU 1744 TaxID=3140368 RepID=UPI00325BF306